MVNRRQTPPMNLILISRRYIAGKQAGAWMPVQRKIFRIEELFSNGESPELSGFDAGHEQRHTEIMTELRALRSTLSAQSFGARSLAGLAISRFRQSCAQVHSVRPSGTCSSSTARSPVQAR